jgi:signal transduction histidine kinase
MRLIGRITRLAERPQLPRRTVRMRLTLLYGALFLLSGAVLLAITYLLVQHATANLTPKAGQPAQIPASQGELPTSDQAGWLQAQAAEQRADQLHQLLTQSGIALGLMSVVSIGLGWVVAGRVLHPLTTITTAAREISATNLHQRLALNGPDDELKELGDTIDQLLGRLEASFQSQRRFIANASHELRTPLAWQRTLLQVTLTDPDPTPESLRTTHQHLLDATYQQERLIDALLTLARGERGLDRRQPLDLADVANRVLLAKDIEANQRDIRLTSTLHPAPTTGDSHLVERLIANLVDNALRYNIAPGQLEISTSTTTEGALLTVTNTGPVVPAAELERLFQPFKRLDTDRTNHDGGLGLGLSIVHAIATAHDATIQAHPRPHGGLHLTITFPTPTPAR